MLTFEQVMKGGLGPNLLGLQIDVVVGTAVAFVTVIGLQKWGSDYWILKGALVGLVSWALFYTVLSRFLSHVHPIGSLLQAEISFFTHLVFGISLVGSAIWLSERLDKRGSKYG